METEPALKEKKLLDSRAVEGSHPFTMALCCLLPTLSPAQQCKKHSTKMLERCPGSRRATFILLRCLLVNQEGWHHSPFVYCLISCIGHHCRVSPHFRGLFFNVHVALMGKALVHTQNIVHCPLFPICCKWGMQKVLKYEVLLFGVPANQTFLQDTLFLPLLVLPHAIVSHHPVATKDGLLPPTNILYFYKTWVG